MLWYFLFLAITVSVGSVSFSVFIKKLLLVFIPKLGTMFTKNSLKIPANFLSLLVIFPFSSRVMCSVDFIDFIVMGLYCSPKLLTAGNIFEIQIFVITSLSFSCYTYTYISLFMRFHFLTLELWFIGIDFLIFISTW